MGGTADGNTAETVAVAGIRFGPSGRVLWCVSRTRDLAPGALCAVLDPGGSERTARVAVAPERILRVPEPAPGWTVLRAVTDDEAAALEPAASLAGRVGDLTLEAMDLAVAAAPDGSHLALLAPEPAFAAAAHLAAELATPLRLPVVARAPDGRLPDPALPDLGATITHAGDALTVVGISVFRGDVTLERADGERVIMPLVIDGAQADSPTSRDA